MQHGICPLLFNNTLFSLDLWLHNFAIPIEYNLFHGISNNGKAFQHEYGQLINSVKGERTVTFGGIHIRNIDIHDGFWHLVNRDKICLHK